MMNVPSAISPSEIRSSPVCSGPRAVMAGPLFLETDAGEDLVDPLGVGVEESLERIAGEIHVVPVVALQRVAPRRRLHGLRDDVDQLLLLRFGDAGCAEHPAPVHEL